MMMILFINLLFKHIHKQQTNIKKTNNKKLLMLDFETLNTHYKITYFLEFQVLVDNFIDKSQNELHEAKNRET